MVSGVESVTDQRPIFVQALWRTSSTYVLSKFRAEKELVCFTKPFHHSLEKSKEELKRDFQAARRRFGFGFVGKNYYREFPKSDQGVPGYDWSFAMQDYALNTHDDHPTMEAYISGLLRHAEKKKAKRPMMQFNRGVLRAAWLQERFGATSLYVTRSPVRMMDSYQRLAQDKVQYYMACYLGILGQNRNNPLFTEMADHAGAPAHEADSYRRHFIFYNRLANALDDDKARDVLGFFWSLGIVNATTYTDAVLDMELAVNENNEAEAIFQDTVSSATGLTLDFSDLVVGKPKETMRTSKAAQRITREALEKLNPDWQRLETYRMAQASRAQLHAFLG